MEGGLGLALIKTVFVLKFLTKYSDLQLHGKTNVSTIADGHSLGDIKTNTPGLLVGPLSPS